jgi:hypothetical protein
MNEGLVKFVDTHRTITYKLNGLFHREDGPAVIYEDESKKYWYKNGKMHKEDGPAVIYKDESKKFWYKKGKMHREDGPAVEWANGDKEWYLEGIQYTKKEFNNKIKELK